ncbi:MAG: indolepyruvate oxidoreductase subunit beta [candidate division Zixibacteria bacterium]|nr:indolepyruvate oxidoreductase subunit beta [candidate division Zixibacteria bacterium]
MSENKFDILIVGVGGQGVLLASEIISAVALRAGFDVKKSEVHGMSQRGGVVTSHVKIADKVYSPTIAQGQADIIMAFEQAEGLRAINWMKKDGIAIISRTTLIPAIVTSSKELHYPEDPIAAAKAKAAKVISVDADDIARELGNPRVVNTILLGVASNYLPFSVADWTEAMKSKIKERFVEINLTAFERGRSIKLDTVKA